jgi:predicted RNA-binding Zn ribbon-like protein
VLVRDLDAAALLAMRLINTYDPYQADPELLPSPSALRTFLRANGFAVDREPSRRDLANVRALRDSLRKVFAARSPQKARAVNEAIASAPVTPAVSGKGGDWELTYEVEDNAALASRLAAVCGLGLADALQRYGPERLKVCDVAPCQDVFLDLSKNLVRRHCSRTCANRLSAAAFRARQKPRRRARQAQR